MMAVEISATPAFHAGTPQVLFEGRYSAGAGSYDVAPDSRRFLMFKEPEGQTAAGQVNIVVNWFEELKRLVPPGGKK